MAAWRLAPALVAMRDEANRIAPGRSRRSDGDLGDRAHADRVSGHNPNVRGIVCALDLTNDPAGGFDAHAHADVLQRRRDPRIKLLISRRRICSAPTWQWRPYAGVNPHDQHAHFEIYSTTRAEQDTSPWWPAPVEEDDVALVDVLVDPQVAGGVWALLADGTVRNFRGARDLGQPADHAFWVGRQAKQFVPSDRGGFVVMATSGELYGFPLT